MRNHFDRGNKGCVTKVDFLHIINSDFIEQKTFSLSIEDVIKPLASKARAYNVNLTELFDRYDSNRNGRLSAEELQMALNKNKIPTSEEDMLMMKDYFRNRLNQTEISRQDFIKLMNTEFKRVFDEQAARKSLNDIRMRTEELKLDPTAL